MQKKVEADLNSFKSHEQNIKWIGSDEAPLSNGEKVIIFLQGKFASFGDQKISDCKVVWTTNRLILYGTEIRGTYLASVVSREYEKIRGLSDKSNELQPLKTIGGALAYDKITQLKIMKLGEIFSLYFFGDNLRKLILNEITQSEKETIIAFLKKHNSILIDFDEFQIPLRDVIFLLFIGLVIMVLGWLFIVLIF
ncbi:MAG: hypothetical protein ACFFAJ_06105 [Candidatus Hodarchaeota archaeon]